MPRHTFTTISRLSNPAVLFLALALLLVRPLVAALSQTASGHPVWPEVSPDGAHILFQQTVTSTSSGGASPTTSPAIFVMAADGSDQRIVATGLQAVWFQNGKQIVFTEGGFGGGGSTRLVVARPDGSDRKQTPVIAVQIWRPSVSPDGTVVAFGSFAGGPMHVMQLDGSNMRELPAPAGSRSLEPTWSHDGRIAFVVWADPIPPSRFAPSTALYVMKPDGTDRTLVATVPGQAQWIAWSRDDRRIALQAHEGHGGNIIVIDLGKGSVQQITHHDDDENDEAPSWTPDGHLYFQSHRNGQFGIYRMNLDGSGQQQVSK